MPLPFILGVGAAISGATGAVAGVKGANKMKQANNKMKLAEKNTEENLEKFKETEQMTSQVMDNLGKLELEILCSFEEFSNIIAKIQNKPIFENYNKKGVDLPAYEPETIADLSIGAGVLLGGLGGATVGTAGGFAAAGATTSAVMALGTASTGTAIASLSGAAATNATLAALGGGALAAGGGGIALGTTVLGAATLGVGLLVGGAIFNFTGGKLSDKADTAHEQMLKNQELVNKICDYLNELAETAEKYISSLKTVQEEYQKHLSFISVLVYKFEKVDWHSYTVEEKQMVENTVLLVGLLHKMCGVNLVNQAEKEGEFNTINRQAVFGAISDSDSVLRQIED